MTITTLHAGTRPLCLVLDVSPDLWFSNIKDDIDQAKQVCQQCPLQQPCLPGLAVAFDRGDNPARICPGQLQFRQETATAGGSVTSAETGPWLPGLSKYCSRLCKGRASDQRRKAAAADSSALHGGMRPLRRHAYPCGRAATCESCTLLPMRAVLERTRTALYSCG